MGKSWLLYPARQPHAGWQWRNCCCRNSAICIICLNRDARSLMETNSLITILLFGHSDLAARGTSSNESIRFITCAALASLTRNIPVPEISLCRAVPSEVGELAATELRRKAVHPVAAAWRMFRHSEHRDLFERSFRIRLSFFDSIGIKRCPPKVSLPLAVPWNLAVLVGGSQWHTP